MKEKYWSLQQCPLFEQLSTDELQHLESQSRIRDYRRNCPVYLPADDASSVYLLTSGLVKICHLTPEGKESILAFVQPGEVFGELAIFGMDARDEYVETVEASKVVKIPAAEVRRLIATHCEISLEVTRMMGIRRQRIERRLKNLLFLTNRDRLVHLLLDLAEQFGVPEAGGIRLKIKLSHQDLAKLIGSTRETITVTFGQLRDLSLVDSHRRQILLKEPAQLASGVNRPVPCLNRADEPTAKMMFAV